MSAFLAVVVKRADEFFFLEGMYISHRHLQTRSRVSSLDIIGWEQEEQSGRSRKKVTGLSGGPLHFAHAPGKTVESIQAEEPSDVANGGELNQ